MNKNLNIRILDKRKSFISNDEIDKYRDEVTKPINSPICQDKALIDVLKVGITSAQKHGVCLLKEQLDV